MHTGLVVHPTYRLRNRRPVIQLYGRLEDGSAFLVEDDRFRPYFFVPSTHAEPVARRLHGKPGFALDACELKDLAGRPLHRVAGPNPGELRRLRDALRELGVPTLEADLRFPYRYLIDRGLRVNVHILGESHATPEDLHCFHNPTLEPAIQRGPAAQLHPLSIDLETTPDAGEILSVALVGPGVDEVHLRSPDPVIGAQCHRDESWMLYAVTARLREIDPDVILGWNVVDFDLEVLARRCAALGVPCHIGRDEELPRFQRDRGYTRQRRAEIAGRMVIDGIALVRDALRLEDYRLETVARAVLGRGKLIDEEVPDKAAEILRQFREEPEALVAYNREDARLVLDILEHEGLLDLAIERSLLTGMQLDRVSASIASFDLVVLPELRRSGRVAPDVEPDRESEALTGGAVLDSVPGLAEHVALFDFKSLYPSLIRTFNLDPLAHACAAGETDAIEAPNGARFSRRHALLPEILERFAKRRDEAKRRGEGHADQAIKIMMNSMYGVLGSTACRFFDPGVANAITRFGQQTLAWTADAFEEEGVEVLYGDTDSVFVKLRREDGGANGKIAAQAEGLRSSVDARIRERVRREYGVEPQLELELERVYARFFLPRVRGGGQGSKKRYAGWSQERGLEIVGLESVRRDWPAIARRLQEGLFDRLFHDQELLPFVEEVVERLRSGELDPELVYVKRLRKGSLDRYTKSNPPHIQAARKAAELTGGRVSPVIRYVVTNTGPEPVLPGRPLPPGIDHRHYLERVLRPVADAILGELGRSF
ncbi:MAG: DNA polymerase II, partial [Deltaproteobacteria bacterium]|nr:DNA polymerase II [Deltaproteobacteria bacterium]